MSFKKTFGDIANSRLDSLETKITEIKNRIEGFSHLKKIEDTLKDLLQVLSSVYSLGPNDKLSVSQIKDILSGDLIRALNLVKQADQLNKEAQSSIDVVGSLVAQAHGIMEKHYVREKESGIYDQYTGLKNGIKFENDIAGFLEGGYNFILMSIKILDIKKYFVEQVQEGQKILVPNEIGEQILEHFGENLRRVFGEYKLEDEAHGKAASDKPFYMSYSVGGGEFMIMSGSEANDIRFRIEKLFGYLSNVRVGSQINDCVSVGFTFGMDSYKKGDDFDDICKRARGNPRDANKVFGYMNESCQDSKKVTVPTEKESDKKGGLLGIFGFGKKD